MVIDECVNLKENRQRTHVQVLERRAKRDTDEVVTDGIEQVTAMRWVDVEEDARNDDSLFFEQLLEEGLGVRVLSAKEIHVPQTLTRPLLIGGGSFSRLSQM